LIKIYFFLSRWNSIPCAPEALTVTGAETQALCNGRRSLQAILATDFCFWIRKPFHHHRISTSQAEDFPAQLLMDDSGLSE
jgi:hypothetical protein